MAGRWINIAGSLILIVLFCSFASSCPPATGVLDPYSDKGWKLVWSDEFEGDSLDMSKWNIETGTGIQYGQYIDGWGNDEAQYYRAENVRVEDGVLYLEAKKENVGGRKYTSGKISTGAIKQGPLESGTVYPLKYEAQKGKVEVRARSSRGAGFWPAIWMIGADSNEFGPYPVQGWPRCGEIDIMEVKGGMEYRQHGTIHYGESFPEAYWYRGDFKDLKENLADDWHLYGVAWDKKVLHFLLDDKVWQTIYFEDLEKPRANLKAFTGDIGFAINLNLAVGGRFISNKLPDDSVFDPDSSFEDRCLMVDYVRVYRR